MFQKTVTASKHENGLLQLAAIGILLLCVVSDEIISTVCHHILSFSVRTILPGERRYLCLSVCCVEK